MKAIASLLCALLATPALSTAQQQPVIADSAARSPSDTAEAKPLAPVRVTAPSGHGRSYRTAEVSSALKLPGRALNVPQAISVVSRELIRDRSIQSIAEAVRYMPGISAAQGEGNRDQLVIRGNSSTADFFVDGIRDDVQFFRDVYNVERIEAIKGPNAMVFGRGGGGGVVNRVLKEPVWRPVRELLFESGEYGHTRAAADFGLTPSASVAARLNAVLEHSGSFRDAVRRKRRGLNPSVKLLNGAGVSARLDFEHFRDERTADRGIPSFEGRPFETEASTFFGDPSRSFSDARVNAISGTIEGTVRGAGLIRSSSRAASYDKFYQNVFPGAMSAAGSQVSISAYNNRTRRRNLFNQTDFSLTLGDSRLEHSLLIGAEAGRQATDNFRATGYFNNTATSANVSATSPTVSIPLTFRQAAGDADNHVTATALSAFIQDRVSLGSEWIVVAGVRLESFDLRYHNNRDDSFLERRDQMVSPRAAVVHKPSPRLSLYGSFSVSHLPSSGDQFASLTDVTKVLEPERFRNAELGVKYEIANGLELSTAAYVLDRTNSRATDPADPTRILQTGRQRTSGIELELQGAVTARWEIVAGGTRQHARLTSATTAGPAGAVVPLAPRFAASVWNRFDLGPKWGLGAGWMYQSTAYAGIDNTVELPAFMEADGAVYYDIGRRLRAQVNIDNLLNGKHYHTAHSNNNISPSEPRTVRLSISTEF